MTSHPSISTCTCISLLRPPLQITFLTILRISGCFLLHISASPVSQPSFISLLLPPSPSSPLLHTLNFGESASAGTGMTMSTLLAVERFLNCPFAWREKEKGEGGRKRGKRVQEGEAVALKCYIYSYLHGN